MKINLLNIVDESFSTYAAMTIQDRALIDARDAIKPAPRQCMYAQLLEKITYKKPFKKSNKSVAAAMDHFYVHGDASCYALLARMAKSFAMRYPLEDFDGSYGTISGGNTEAASRYTEMRLGELGTLMYEGIDKNCIDKWFNNYDDTEQFPSVTPSLGYYNICNGTLGIATAISSSIPQFNLKEVNEAMIKLLWNPDIDYNEIYCPPDFCTGSTILNADEVKETLKVGHGRSIILRSTVTYDDKEHCIYITDVPYGVYTGTIVNQIKDCVEKGELIGIKKIDDLSTRVANIKIILEKGVNVTKFVKDLYKLTSVQSSYTINMVMLDNGTTPKIFGWREALQAHLDHEKSVYTKIHEFDLDTIFKRINIIDGLLLAIANIDEVVELIKKSNNKNEAKDKLISRFGFNEEQAAAILKMTLSKLINLEIESFKNEKEKLLLEAEKIKEILNNKDLLYKEIEEGLRRVANKFGDDRRTTLKNLDYKGTSEDAEPIEKKELIIYYTNLGNIYTVESSTLMKSRRGTKGKKIKLADNEVITKIISDNNFSDLYAFTASGSMCTVSLDELPLDTKVNLSQLLNLEIGDKVTTLVSLASRQKKKNFIFITKKGMIKKSETSLYNIKRGKTMKAIKLKEGDEVVNVMLMDEGEVGILSSSGCFVKISIDDITPIGKIAMGVKAIALKEGEYVIDAKEIKSSDKYLITLSKNGIVKKTSIEDFAVTNRATRGKQVSGVRDNDTITKILTIEKDCDIIIIVNKRSIKISTSEIPELSRTATGVKGINLTSGETALDVVVSSEE